MDDRVWKEYLQGRYGLPSIGPDIEDSPCRRGDTSEAGEFVVVKLTA
jgi:hypothetical protein